MINRRSFADGVVENIVSPVDSAWATPLNNGELFFDLEKQLPYPGPDVKDPYPNINHSPNAVGIKDGLFAFAVLCIIGNCIIQFYKRLRKKEALSSYFVFEKLPGIKESIDERRILIQIDECTSEVLLASAYYYNGDLSAVVLAWRRFSAALTRSRPYLNLKKYLRTELNEGKTKKQIFEEIDQKINEYLAKYINTKTIYGLWIAEKRAGRWIVRAEKLPQSLLKLPQEAKEIKKEKNKNLALQVWQFIEARIDELGKVSYFYWIAMFISYFFANVGVIKAIYGVGMVVWPPILISGVFLLSIWVVKAVIKILQDRKKAESLLNESTVSQDVNLSLESVGQHIQIEDLSQGKTNFVNSKLNQEIKKIIQKRADMIFVGAIFKGFLGGFMNIALISWLLFSAIGLIVTISPIGLAIIAGATLLAGITWGIYSAWQHFKTNDALLENRKKDLTELKKNIGEVPNISLREYDRLFRCGHTNKTVWTTTKQVSKRVWVGLVGVGTGIFVLKISGYGVATAILTALGISASVAFFPLVGVFLGGGLLYAALSVYQYHLESQEAQLDKVLNSLSHPLFMGNQKKTVASNESVNGNKHGNSNQPRNSIVDSWKLGPEGENPTLSNSLLFLKEPKPRVGLPRSNGCPKNLNYRVN